MSETLSENLFNFNYYVCKSYQTVGGGPNDQYTFMLLHKKFMHSIIRNKFCLKELTQDEATYLKKCVDQE